MRRQPGAWLVVAVLVVIAVWLRVRGLAFGLPAVYNPDEVAIMSRALAFAKGDFNPHNFLYPTLYFYVLFGWIGGYFALARLAGIVASASEFQQSFFLDPTRIYLAGRSLSVLCGALTVIATWRLGTRLVDRTTGLVAAGLVAVAPFAVRDAHYVKHDVPATLAVLLAMLVMARALDDETFGPRVFQADEADFDARPAGPSSMAALAAASLVTGLAVSVHYYLVFACVPLALVAWWAIGAGTAARLRTVALTGATAGAGFFLGSPFLLAEPMTAVRDVAANRRIVMDRAVEAAGGVFPSAGTYARMLATEALGWPVAVAAVIGLLAVGWRAPRRAVFLLAFPVPFLLFISNTVAATRYLNPVLPFVAILAACGIGVLVSRLGARAAGTVVLTALAAIPAVRSSVEVGSFFRQADTRSLALDYIRAHVPAGSTVVVQPYSVPLAQSREGLVEALRAHLGDEQRASTKFQLQLGLPSWPSPSYRVLWLGSGGLDVDKIYVDPADLAGPGALGRLRRLGVQYVVLKRSDGVSAAAQPLAKALAREARLEAVFTPYRATAAGDRPPAAEPFLHNAGTGITPALERPGPGIELWKL